MSIKYGYDESFGLDGFNSIKFTKQNIIHFLSK